MSKLTRLEKYHLNYVSQRHASKVVAVTPAAMEVEKRAVERESKGQYRIAARLWLLCMDGTRRRRYQKPIKGSAHCRADE